MAHFAPRRRKGGAVIRVERAFATAAGMTMEAALKKAISCGPFLTRVKIARRRADATHAQKVGLPSGSGCTASNFNSCEEWP